MLCLNCLPRPGPADPDPESDRGARCRVCAEVERQGGEWHLPKGSLCPGRPSCPHPILDSHRPSAILFPPRPEHGEFCFSVFQAKSYIQSLPQSPKKDFTQLFPRASPQGESWSHPNGHLSQARHDAHGHVPAAADLLDKMLELDVDKRLTAAQALAHPFFEPIRDPEEETEAQQPFADVLEQEKLTVDEWKRKRSPHRTPPQPKGVGTPVLQPSPSPVGFSPAPSGFLLHCLMGGLSLPPHLKHPLPTEHLFKEVSSFSPIARKDSRRRSGMKLQ